MVMVEKQITIQADPNTVWQYIDDPQKELQWRSPEVVELKRLDDGPLKVGSQYEGVTKIMGQTDSYTNEITELEPGRKVSWKSVQVSGSMGSMGSYVLQPVGEHATQMTLRMNYIPTRFMGTFMQPMVKIIAGRIIARFLRNLKSLCENPQD